MKTIQVWWCPVLVRQRQKDQEFKVSLDYSAYLWTTRDYLRKKSEWLHVNTSANVKPLASRLLRTTSVCKGPWIRAAQLCSDLRHWSPAGFCWWGGRCQEWSL